MSFGFLDLRNYYIELVWPFLTALEFWSKFANRASFEGGVVFKLSSCWRFAGFQDNSTFVRTHVPLFARQAFRQFVPSSNWLVLSFNFRLQLVQIRLSISCYDRARQPFLTQILSNYSLRSLSSYFDFIWVGCLLSQTTHFDFENLFDPCCDDDDHLTVRSSPKWAPSPCWLSQLVVGSNLRGSPCPNDRQILAATWFGLELWSYFSACSDDFSRYYVR